MHTVKLPRYWVCALCAQAVLASVLVAGEPPARIGLPIPPEMQNDLDILNDPSRTGSERDAAEAALSKLTDARLVRAVFELLDKPVEGRDPSAIRGRWGTEPGCPMALSESKGWPRAPLIVFSRERLWWRVAANLPDDAATGDLFASLGAESRCTLQDLAIIRASNQAIVKASPTLQRLLWDFATAASPAWATQDGAAFALGSAEEIGPAWTEALIRFAWEERDTAAGTGLCRALRQGNTWKHPDPRLAVLVLDRIRSLESEPGDPKRSDREMSRRLLALELVSYLRLEAPGTERRAEDDDRPEAEVARGEAAINAIRFEEARLREEAQQAFARPYQPPAALQLPPVLPVERLAEPEPPR